MSARSDRIGVALVFVALVAANLVNHLLLPGQPWPGAIGLTVVLAGIAVSARMSARELGLDRADLRSGLRWGGTGAGVVAACFAVAGFVPPVLASLTPSTTGVASVLTTALVVIPLTTVLPEELAFRGVLLGLLDRTMRTRSATIVSSAAFGLWHLLAAGGGTVNRTAADSVGEVVGSAALGRVLLVLGTVLATTGAGFVFCWLRRRSGSLIAPMLVHWALNACGVVFVALA